MITVILSVIIMLLGGLDKTETGLKFDHSAHAGMRDMECVTCHRGMKDSKLSSDRNIPDHEICSECHTIEEDPANCGFCHFDPDDPKGLSKPETDLIFSHKGHLKGSTDKELCLSCHIDQDKLAAGLISSNCPVRANCFNCHDGSRAPSECSLCHTKVEEMITLVHDPGWEHEHKFATDLGGENCVPCHQPETFCSNCHAGDNLVETVHELNYRYFHGIDARSDEILCQTCHEPATFCSSCHSGAGHIPLDHMASDWALPPYTHAESAMQDVETCAACHSSDSPVCVNCHFDSDGILGTNPPVHPSSIDDLGEGLWHDDPGFQCFVCHVNTQNAGAGFCGYCHGAVD